MTNFLPETSEAESNAVVSGLVAQKAPLPLRTGGVADPPPPPPPPAFSGFFKKKTDNKEKEIAATFGLVLPTRQSESCIIIIRSIV